MKTSFSSLVNTEGPVLVDFSAEWCGPCKALAPILRQVKVQLGDRLKIVKIDVDRNAALAGKFQVRGVPTLVLFKKGQPVWRQSGVLAADAILQAVRPYL